MLASGSVTGCALVLAESSKVLEACSDAIALRFGLLTSECFAACAGAPVATVLGVPDSPPIVAG